MVMMMILKGVMRLVWYSRILQHNVHHFNQCFWWCSITEFFQNFSSSNWIHKLFGSYTSSTEILNALPMRFLWPFIVNFREQETVHTSSNLNPGQPRVNTTLSYYLHCLGCEGMLRNENGDGEVVGKWRFIFSNFSSLHPFGRFPFI